MVTSTLGPAVTPVDVRLDGWPDEAVGNGTPVPVLGGGALPYAYLDNAASTPALRAVLEAVQQFLPWYSSVHRGTGIKSQVATAAYDAARERVRSFLGADDRQAVIFTKSATEGLNRLSHLAAARQSIVFVSALEHHANLLPWRLRARETRLIRADGDGVLDEDDLRRQLREAPRGHRLVSVCGASNVTGYTPPIHRLARLAHEYGAEIVVDGAQLVAHRALNLRGNAPGEGIDYFAFSSHKVYAPFGSGALVAPKQAFDGAPLLVGGGATAEVTPDDVIWHALPDREEAGSPNVVGAVALGVALARLDELGREALHQHELALTDYALRRLALVPGLRVLGPRTARDRVGVVSFVLDGIPHDVIATTLSRRHAIGVRHGRFCAHPGLDHMLAARGVGADGATGQGCTDGRGAVRVSLGLQNTRAEIDRLGDALVALAERRPSGPQPEPGIDPDALPPAWLDAVPPAVRRLLDPLDSARCGTHADTVCQEV
ncbi:MAG: aminotransferase class V-fold PLP-dependent enzyme [Chloroflexota bacterium]